MAKRSVCWWGNCCPNPALQKPARVGPNYTFAMNPFYERMREDIERSELAKIRGLSTRDVVSKQYSDSDLELIVSQLRERPLTSDAAFRLASFIFERRENQ